MAERPVVEPTPSVVEALDLLHRCHDALGTVMLARARQLAGSLEKPIARPVGARRTAIEVRIATSPASTLEGLALNARVAAWTVCEQHMPDSAEMGEAWAVETFEASIMCDLLALDMRET